MRGVRIAVSGASGLLGSALVPALREAGHEVVRLVRRDAVAPDEVRWDPAAGFIDTEALGATEAMVNLSGATIGRRWTASRKREILDSRVETTSLLARTTTALDPPPAVLVCTGGVGIYGNRRDEVLTEESDLGTGFLADVGRAWEAAAQPARDAGIRVVNFRQGIVLTRKGGALQKMLPPFRMGVGGVIGDGSQSMSWIALDDAVGAVQHALSTEGLRGPVNAVSPMPVTNRGFTKALGRVLGRPTILPMPAFAARLAFGEMADALLLASLRVVPDRLRGTGYAFRYPELEPALRHLLAG